LIDIHFHGACGIDLMHASPGELQELSKLLWDDGVAGFCPTTVSADRDELQEALTKIGRWIRSEAAPGALPLGIHLEGPFINADFRGAHPSGAIRPVRIAELSDLWEASQRTIKVITIAPENLIANKGSADGLTSIVSWARSHQIRLSLGHSRATEAEAHHAFKAGFRGLTHAWNALPFHHRSPGPLGAAVGSPEVFIETIIDQVHVSPTLIRWLLRLHPPDRICFISDAAPAAGCPEEQSVPFGPLRVHAEGGACRLKDGSLAGGGEVLSTAFCRWLESESRRLRRPLRSLMKEALPCVTTTPLKYLGVRPSQVKTIRKTRQVVWNVTKKGVRVSPLRA